MELFDNAPGMDQGTLFSSCSLKGLGNLKRPPAIGFFGGKATLSAIAAAETRGEVF